MSGSPPARLLAATTWLRANAWMVGLWALALVVGIAMRNWILHSSLGMADLDESTVGIQAHRFNDGHLNAFFLNQAYGGTVETGLVAATFRIFGSTVITLKVVPMVAAFVAAIITWRTAVAMRLSRTGQWVVPVLVWCGPAYAVLFSTKERGFYGVALVLAAAYPLLVLRISRHPVFGDVMALGFCVGLGWWQTPLTFLVAVPAVIWLVCVRPSVLRELWWAALPALAAAAPWFIWNAAHDWRSLHTAPGFGTSWGDRYVDWLERLRVVMGIETPFDAQRGLVGGRWTGVVLLALVVVLATLRTRRAAPGLLATVVVGYGLLYALNTLAAGVGADPRYMYLMVPVVALCLGSLLPEVDTDPQRFAVGALALAVITASSAWGLAGVRAASDRPRPNSFLSSPGIDEVAELLDRQGVEAVISDTAGMQIAFLTDQRVVGGSFAVPRLASFERRGRAADPSVYVLDETLLNNDDVLRDYLERNRVPFEERRYGKWHVFLLAKRVLPVQAGLLVFGGQLGIVPEG